MRLVDGTVSLYSFKAILSVNLSMSWTAARKQVWVAVFSSRTADSPKTIQPPMTVVPLSDHLKTAQGSPFNSATNCRNGFHA
mmetsp:Transcript_63384/g.169495  ORF Transcript_63384/g.169495 Transcript_63384/m.169495 type:complete len:82 (-) Transcript_63384:207-452(-)